MFFEMIANGSHSSCPAPDAPCTCEARLYATTGTLAFIAGFAQWVVGYRYSMAALSDSLHALTDAFADLVGMRIAQKVRSKPLRAKKYRSLGNKVIAILLALGAITIAHEARNRWEGDAYIVWLPAVVLVGLFGLCIDMIRFRMLSKAKRHAGNETMQGLIEHAKSDAWHSGIISAVALLAIGGSLTSIDTGTYHFLVLLADYLASLGLAGYMLLVLTPRVWRGAGCGHQHTHHDHGSGCGHDHHR